jgi:hypothetical protein
MDSILSVLARGMANRRVFRITPLPFARWKLAQDGYDKVLGTFNDKAEGIESGRRWAKANMPSQLVIHKLDGTIQTEYTYGADPVRYPG